MKILKNTTDCACIKTSDLSWRKCDCSDKQHFMCRKKLVIDNNENVVNENLFFTKNNIIEASESVEDNKSFDKKSVKISNLLLNLNVTQKDRLIDPQAQSVKSNKELEKELEIENSEEMEKELMHLANYLMSPSFNEQYFNSTTVSFNFESNNKHEQIQQNMKEDNGNNKSNSKENLMIKKLINDTFSIKQKLPNELKEKNQTEFILAKIQLLKDTSSVYELNCPKGDGFYSNFPNDPELRQFVKCESINQNYNQITLYKCFENYKFDPHKSACISKNAL